jgi:hypothetical protein
LKLINLDLLGVLRAALYTVQREHKPAEFPNVRVMIDDAQAVSVDIRGGSPARTPARKRRSAGPKAKPSGRSRI